ncbi:MAG TPA: NAD(P)-dependent oxidoreductase [Candidatus Paceibacterota bacterium]|nr:NAD(P)-dependent oxidoreductase [Candidatus Paceibacterota bacterium]
MRVTVIGANGLVGSAFVRLLRKQPNVELICVTRQNFETLPVIPSDVVIEAACNSKKFLADQDPVSEFDASVTHRLKSLQRFPATLQLHISSVDVYSDLTSKLQTEENSIIDPAQTSRYGFHKYLAEKLVQHYSPGWLILRLAGMVGPGLRKNPVYDILNGLPLRIHPESRYQYMLTDDVARVAWALVEARITNEIFNICGEGLISMEEIARLAGRSLNLSALPPNSAPRVVDASNAKVSRRFPTPKTTDAIREFIQSEAAGR